MTILEHLFTSPSLLTAFLANLGVFTVGWIYCTYKTNLSFADSAWGLGISVQALIYYFANDNANWRQLLFTIIVAMSGVRLAIYAYFRGIKSNKEDKRYRELMREKIGYHFWWVSYFIVFLPQAVINQIIGLAFFAFNYADNPDPKDDTLCPYRYYTGIAIMIFGMVFQAIGDHQLSQFKLENETGSPNDAKKLMTTGLWRYTRHPNYFGDTAFFWGVYLVNMSAYIYITFFVPLIMNILLRFLSGVPLTERFLARDYGERFYQYKRTTNTFIPWLPSYDVKDNQKFVEALP